MLLPTFEVDTVNAGGLTTLMAIRNLAAQPQQIVISYRAVNADEIVTTEETLAPMQVKPINSVS